MPATMDGHEKSVNAVDLSPDGRLAITGSTDRKVMVWEWDSCEVLHTMGGYRNTVAAAAFSPAGDVAVTASYDGRIGFWDNGSDSMDVVTSHPKNVTAVSFSPSGDMLATAGLGNIVKVWNMETREVQSEFEAPGQAATNCLFLPDGTLCCLTYEGQIAIYTPEGHELLSEGSIDDAPSGSAAPIPGTNSLFCSIRGGVIVVDLDSMTTSAQSQHAHQGDVRGRSFKGRQLGISGKRRRQVQGVGDRRITGRAFYGGDSSEITLPDLIVIVRTARPPNASATFGSALVTIT